MKWNTHIHKKTNTGKYRPDFYLPDYDIYIEHFGVSRNNNAPWLSEIEERKYIEGMQWKRKLHESNHTHLIETYSFLFLKAHYFLCLKRLWLQPVSFCHQ